jgi:lysophospholipase L1-like esterase
MNPIKKSLRIGRFLILVPLFFLSLAGPSYAQEIYDAFGDSITNGFVGGVGDTGGYVPVLEDLLNRRVGPSAVVNSGWDGERTGGGAARLPDVLSAVNPKVLLLMEGSNDISRDIGIDEIVANLKTMIDAAKTKKVRVILGTIIPRNTDLDVRDPGNARAQELNQKIKSLAAENGLQVADQFTHFGGPGYDPGLYSDHLHPDETGYRVMAHVWLDAVIHDILASGERKGDIDSSGRIDGWDLFLLALAFGTEEGLDGFSPLADLNLDGIVDGQDLAVLSSHFGQND